MEEKVKKQKPMHLAHATQEKTAACDSGEKTAAKNNAKRQFTTDPALVTCKNCQKTVAFKKLTTPAPATEPTQAATA